MSTMGGTISHFFVKLYKLKYSLDGMTWVDYREKLNGPKSGKEAVYAVLAKLAEPFVARYLRIFNAGVSQVGTMRAEVYGCFAEELPPYDGKRNKIRNFFIKTIVRNGLNP